MWKLKRAASTGYVNQWRGAFTVGLALRGLLGGSTASHEPELRLLLLVTTGALA
jgi:hypothetical protein